MPEWLKGAVLKTARRREASRGFESHPRRLDKPKCSISTDFERSLQAYKLPLESAETRLRLGFTGPQLDRASRSLEQDAPRVGAVEVGVEKRRPVRQTTLSELIRRQLNAQVAQERERADLLRKCSPKGSRVGVARRPKLNTWSVGSSQRPFSGLALAADVSLRT